MTLVPYRKYLVESQCSPEQAISIINEEINKDRKLFSELFLGQNNKYFGGEVNKNTFTISRVKDRRICIAEIRGVVEKHNNGSIIKITMNMDVGTIVAIIVLILAALTVGVKSATSFMINIAVSLTIYLYFINMYNDAAKKDLGMLENLLKK